MNRWKWHCTSGLLFFNLSNWNLTCNFYLGIYKTYQQFKGVGQFRQVWRQNLFLPIQSARPPKALNRWKRHFMSGLLCFHQNNWNLTGRFKLMIYNAYQNFRGVGKFRQLWRQNVVFAYSVYKAFKSCETVKRHFMSEILCFDLNNWNLACNFYLIIYKTYQKFSGTGHFCQLWRQNGVLAHSVNRAFKAMKRWNWLHFMHRLLCLHPCMHVSCINTQKLLKI